MFAPGLRCYTSAMAGRRWAGTALALCLLAGCTVDDASGTAAPSPDVVTTAPPDGEPPPPPPPTTLTAAVNLSTAVPGIPVAHAGIVPGRGRAAADASAGGNGCPSSPASMA